MRLTENLQKICTQLDLLASIHPSGIGGSMELYAAARELCGGSPSLAAAKMIADALSDGGCVFILTGFIIHPFKKAETDGAIGSVMLADMLRRSFGAQCVVAAPHECAKAIKAMGYGGKLVRFTKDELKAVKQSKKLIEKYKPSIVISAECPGAGKSGIYRNAAGEDVTYCQAKSDILFDMCRNCGVPAVAIGDRGNETGFGGLSQTVGRCIPNGELIACACEADIVIAGATTEWGIYSLLAAISVLKGVPMATADEQQRLLRLACENGLIDMNGENRPYIDGIAARHHRELIEKMNGIIKESTE